VVTGIVLSYEIGTNWAGYSRSVANVLGPLFMYEALTAFFLEAGFIGIALFGEGRVSKGLATSEAAERVSEGTTHRDISPEFGCEPATQSGCAET
jgi:hypothetical protein